MSRRRAVESTVLGEFNQSGKLTCFYNGELICSLDMAFLHDGVPKMKLQAVWQAPARVPELLVRDNDVMADLKAVLAMPNVCSKESFVRMYDHEVLAQSVLKQFQGPLHDGPGDAGVIRPVPGSDRGIAISCGICPKYSDLDTYWMMACAADEAVRNLIAIGAELGLIAGSTTSAGPTRSRARRPRRRLQARAAGAVLRGAVRRLYRVRYPLISGKDSMKNDYKIGEHKISIPPTVLFTAAAIIRDVTRVVSMDVKKPGTPCTCLGETRNELGGSEYLAMKGQSGGQVPTVDFERARKLYGALSSAIRSGLVASCHDCSTAGWAPPWPSRHSAAASACTSTSPGWAWTATPWPCSASRKAVSW